MSAPGHRGVDLVKRFDDFTAVDGVSFSVPAGTVFSMLGPNGAGKTTTVRMMTTLSIPTSGTARVAGYDVVAEADAVRHSMGLTAQSATVDELLTGRENLRLVGDLYGLDRALLKRSTEELLERFSLTEAGDKVVKDYSGGMRRRLDLAASLIATPPVLFLDEPTTGLDPRSRVELWGVLRDLVRDGTTLSSRPSTSTRPTSWPTASSSSTTGGSSRRARRSSSRTSRGVPVSWSRSPGRTRWRGPRTSSATRSPELHVDHDAAGSPPAEGGGRAHPHRVGSTSGDRGRRHRAPAVRASTTVPHLTGHRAESDTRPSTLISTGGRDGAVR